MKKFLLFILTIVLVCTMNFVPVKAGAYAFAYLTEAAGKQGSTVNVNLNLRTNPGLVTLTVRVTYDTSVLELTKVTDNGILVGSQLNTSYGSPYTISWIDGTTTVNNFKTGDIATYTFKIKENAPVGKTSVQLQVVDSYDVDYQPLSFQGSYTSNVTVECKTHTYGSYKKTDSTQHERTCSACQYVEKTNHTWNTGNITQNASCKEYGNKHYTCTKCGTSKNETIPKTTNHTYGAWSITTKPTCTSKGSQRRSCTICGKIETQSIDATGHSYESWVVSTTATCTKNGTEERACADCSHSERRTISAVGHKFSEPTIVTQPTISSEGLMEGTCTVCNEKTQQVIPCTAKDETTGTVFNAEKGVFAEGTELKIESVTSSNSVYENIKKSLSAVSSDFTIYNISATVNGSAATPNGRVETIFNIPDGYGKEVRLYSIVDGVATVTDSKVSDDGKTISADLSELGTYAICKIASDVDGEPSNDVTPDNSGDAVSPEDSTSKPSETPEANTNQSSDGKDENKNASPVVGIIIGVVAVLAVGGAGVFIFLKKKKKV
ncbi:MAG: hypothetical protein E7384_05435 [Ruminococcaceae bacterium]|nr:hypothetical protein [Oscillospiraceae bacterium]